MLFSAFCKEGQQTSGYDIDGTRLDHQTASGLSLASQEVRNHVLTPNVPTGGAKTYFVELQLRRSGQVVDRNVYWLSTKPDVVDWTATIGFPQATMSQFADLTQLQALPPARVSASATSRRQGGQTVTQVTMTNTSSTPTVGFLLRADVRRGSASGSPDPGDNEVLPIAWSDNDITLWPGESQTLTATYETSDLRGRAPVVTVSGQNASTMTVPAR